MRCRVTSLYFLIGFLVLTAGCAGAKGTSPKSSSSAGPKILLASSGKPTAPSNLSVVATDKTITLTWEMAKWEDRYTFDIYRWQPGRQPMLLDSVPAGVHTYTDPSATPGRYYFYAVVARNVGASISDSSAQINKVALLPPPPLPVYDPLAGYLPPGAYYTEASKNAWIEQKINDIRDKIPYVFITERCANCGGIGIVPLSTYTDGKPDLTYCPVCRGTGMTINVYPKS